MNKCIHAPKLLSDENCSVNLMPKISNSTSSSLNDNDMNIKTIQSLNAELLRLKKSSRKKLKQSRKEIEMLQQRCVTHNDITAHQENDVIEAKSKEKYWHQRCLDAEFKLLQNYKQYDESESSYVSSMNTKSGANKSNAIEIKTEKEYLEHVSAGSAFAFTTKLSDKKWNICSMKRTTKDCVSATGLCSILRLALRSVGKTSKVQDSKSTYESSSFESKSDREQDNNSSEQHYIEREHELMAKLAESEYTIRSLKQTMENNFRFMHSQQAEMECMVETQHKNKKKNQVTHLQKENFLQDQLSKLQNDVDIKNKLVSSHKQREEKHTRYIEELESRLGRALRTLKQTERNGFNHIASRYK